MGSQKNRRLTPQEAKEKLLAACEKLDPAQLIKEHPYTSLLAAAGVGLMLGLSAETRKTTLRLFSFLSKLPR